MTIEIQGDKSNINQSGIKPVTDVKNVEAESTEVEEGGSLVNARLDLLADLEEIKEGI